MFFRRALLVGGSAAATAALLAAVAVGKNGGTSEPDSLTPPVATGKWDRNWDRREPMSMVNLQKINGETGEEELNEKLTKHKAKATRHIFLIRHSQYRLSGKMDEERVLTSLGREQAELTGRRLESLGLKYTHIVHSSMTRAKETAEIISKFFPGVKKSSSDLLREGAPIRPDPPVCHWKPDVEYYEDGARIEAAFRNLIHRADPKQEEDSYEIIVCHANVIRYMICSFYDLPEQCKRLRCKPNRLKCTVTGGVVLKPMERLNDDYRALQIPPEAWLRMSLNNGSISYLVIRPTGNVCLRMLGDSGFMPPEKISRT